MLGSISFIINGNKSEVTVYNDVAPDLYACRQEIDKTGYGESSILVSVVMCGQSTST
jgi:hypothetical protein